MAKLRGLHLRGNTYYSRVVVPTALVGRFGRREIWKSLRTSGRSNAEALHLREASHWAAAFAEAEHGMNIPSPLPAVLADEEVARLARQFFARSKASLDLSGISPTELDHDDRERVREDLHQQLAILSNWKNPDAHVLVGRALKEALRGCDGRASADERIAELIRRALV